MPAPHPERSSSLVLIVDDMAGNLSVLHDALEESGHNVLLALNGPAALERAHQNLPDIILLDDEMPGMHGLEVLHYLKADPATCLIPVVLMSSGSDAVAARAFRSGAVDCFTRPIHTSEFINRLARHLKTASQSPHARSALDAFGHASLSVDPESGRISWQTQLSRDLLARHFSMRIELIPPIVRNWLRSAIASLHKDPTLPLQPLSVAHAESRVIFTLKQRSENGEWLLMLHEESDEARIKAMQAALQLKRCEAEILHWSGRGKTREELADILELSAASLEIMIAALCANMSVANLPAAAALAQRKLNATAPPSTGTIWAPQTPAC